MSHRDNSRTGLFIEELAQRIVADSASTEVAGLSDDEIEQLCADQGLESLPSSYQTFLKLMGRAAGRLFRGTDAFYPSILGMRSDATELLETEGVRDLLPVDAFVFAMHQGYQVYWFRSVAGDDDPSVYLYQEGDSEISREWPSFTQFLSSQYNHDYG